MMHHDVSLSVSDTTSTMLEKVSVEDISSYQAYTIRRLESSQPDCANRCEGDGYE